MRKTLLAVAMMVLTATSASAADFVINDFFYSPSDYQNTAYAAQVAFDSFNANVARRMSVARLGTGTTTDSRGRVIDCNITNGFTVWGGGHGSWAKQKSRGFQDGYKYHVAGPALGVDWSNGALTAGLAGTYSWGKLKGRDIYHDQRTRTYSFIGYAQWVQNLFYINGTIGYARNRFAGHSGFDADVTVPGIGYLGNIQQWGGAKTHSNSWNATLEAGYKFNFSGFTFTPSVGVRYFNDHRNSFTDAMARSVTGGLVPAAFATWNEHYDKSKYHVVELPVGFTLGYEFKAGNALIAPQFRFAYMPELDRKHGSSTYHLDGDPNAYISNAPRRNKNGFIVGGGIQAKLNSMVSLNLDYYANLRGKASEHHLNLGVGVSF